MNREESKKYCVNLICDFVKEYCGGRIDQLCLIDINKVEKDIRFGKPKEYPNYWSMDPDDSIITRAVLFLLYCDEIGDLQLSDIGTKYRGDTIFTPANLMGRSENLFEQNEYTFWAKQSIREQNKDELRKKVLYFISRYHTFPNFMLLPNRKICVDRKNYRNHEIRESFESLNQYRGMNNPGLSDYIDIFLIELQKYINCETVSDTYLNQLFRENDFYFSAYKNNFKKLCESHFVQIMFEAVEESYQLKEAYTFRHYVRWGNPKKQMNYDVEVLKYIAAFENMCEFRGKVIINKLKTMIPDVLH